MTKRCHACKHFLKTSWHHALCRACRKKYRNRLEIKAKKNGKLECKIVTPEKTESFVIEAEPIKGPKGICPQCGKEKALAEVKVMGHKRPCLACYAKAVFV